MTWLPFCFFGVAALAFFTAPTFLAVLATAALAFFSAVGILAAAGFLAAFFSPEAALAFLATAGYIRVGLRCGLCERSPSQSNFLLLLLLLLLLLGDVLALKVAYRLIRRRVFSLSFITSHCLLCELWPRSRISANQNDGKVLLFQSTIFTIETSLTLSTTIWHERYVNYLCNDI